MNNGNAPAYPIHVECPRTGPWTEYGLTKREEFAAMAMQGMCGDPGRRGPIEAYARDAVKFADALLAELAKEQPK